MTGTLPVGTTPPAPKPFLDNLVTDSPTAPATNIASKEHTPPSQASSPLSESTIAGDDSPFDKEPLVFADRAIPDIYRSSTLLALIDLDTRRVVTEATDGFHLNRKSNSEAWVAQHVGEEAVSPCIRCIKGYGPVLGQACVVVDGHLGDACANCHYSNSGSRCLLGKAVSSTEESVKDEADVQNPHITRSVTRVPRPSQTVSSSSTMPPVRVASALRTPRAVSRAPASPPAPGAFLRSHSRSHSPALYESLEEMYAWQLHLARIQDTNGRIISRRRYEFAIAAINQVELEEQAKGRERRERRRE
ncbi:hypothetical protein VF21_00427 [Pseudogymnoascus sp. 05NY08]|nr:hypothetical protein VF21_00427 [Pseudogymnoascus sp. 05NY08]